MWLWKQLLKSQAEKKKYPQEQGVARRSESKQPHVGFSISILGAFYSQDVWHANQNYYTQYTFSSYHQGLGAVCVVAAIHTEFPHNAFGQVWSWHSHRHTAHLATALAEIMICMKQEETSAHLVARRFGKE